MADATSFTPPSPRLSTALLSNVESYSPKGPENVKITTNCKTYCKEIGLAGCEYYQIL